MIWPRSSARRALLAGLLSCACVSTASAQTPSWDADPAVEARAAAVLAGMTTEEKADLATGQVNNFYGFYNNPIERVGIPAQTMADGPIGVRVANPFIDRRTTRFPSGTSMGATFDRALIAQVGTAIGNEAFQTGHNFQLGPTVDIPRTPLWGRGFEGFGEDPLVSGTLSGQYIRGLQTQNVIATIKHFVAYVQEDNRFRYSSNVDERTLREIYARPYEIAIAEGRPGAAMCAFNRINAVYACANPLMNTLLKDDYGFRGFVMSDYDATPNTVQAANNGLDQEQPGSRGTGGENFGARLVAAVEAGEVSMARLNDMALRILRPMVGLGLFDTRPTEDRAFDAAAHAQLARQVAEEGTVLLKNSRDTLPLRNRVRRIAVIGADADNTATQGGGSARVDFTTTSVSTLQGLRDRGGSRTTVTHAQGTDGVSEADLLPGPAAIPSSVLRPTGGGSGARGLSAQFWGNQTFSGDPHLAITDTGVNVNFGFPTWFSAASPKSGASAAVAAQASSGDFTLTGDLSARWTGTLIAPTTAEYRLGLTSRGNATFWLDGEVFVQRSSTTVGTESRTITLRAGEPHSVRVDYSGTALGQYQGGQVRLFWDHPEDVMSPMMRDAVADARAADAAVVVVRDYETEGAVRESDRPTLDLPREQDQLIRRVGDVNPSTIVVVMSGTPSKTSTWEDDAAAILQTWYPGQEQGSALARLLYGDANPSGRLPATVPRDESQVPPVEDDDDVDFTEGVFVGYRGFLQRGDVPSYPFGHGLSYSTFRYNRLRVAGANATPQGDFTVSFRLRNASGRAGAEVVQVYVGRLPERSVPTPPRQLAAFERVTLAARERRDVTLTVPRRSLSYWDTAAQHWVTPAGRVPVYVGGDSETAELAGTLNVRP